MVKEGEQCLLSEAYVAKEQTCERITEIPPEQGDREYHVEAEIGSLVKEVGLHLSKQLQPKEKVCATQDPLRHDAREYNVKGEIGALVKEVDLGQPFKQQNTYKQPIQDTHKQANQVNHVATEISSLARKDDVHGQTRLDKHAEECRAQTKIAVVVKFVPKQPQLISHIEATLVEERSKVQGQQGPVPSVCNAQDEMANTCDRAPLRQASQEHSNVEAAEGVHPPQLPAGEHGTPATPTPHQQADNDGTLCIDLTADGKQYFYY